MPPPAISVVVPTHDTRDLTLRCIDSVAGTPGTEVVLVDDGSRDGTAEAVEERFPDVRVLRHATARGFTRSANRGLEEAAGSILLLLNSDTEAVPGWSGALRRAFEEDPGLGVVGAELRYPDGSPQWSGGEVPTLAWLFVLASGLASLLRHIPLYRRLRPMEHPERREVHWVPGAALAVRRTIWEVVGPLDEGFLLYCQDLDLCHRVRERGWRIAVVPGFGVLHHHGATIGRQSGAVGARDPERLMRDLARWARKHRTHRRAAVARAALRLGLRCRLLGRALVAPFRSRGDRDAWWRDTVCYRRALAALQPERKPGS